MIFDCFLVIVMILNVSGRTDIVAFYTEWFMRRYREGFVDVRNPFYKQLVSRIYFSDVDLILFCTKNPYPIIPYLKEISQPIIFHVTLTSYKKDIEVNVLDKSRIIDGIKQVSNIIGSDNLYVRYDPIFISSKYTVSYHIRAFSRMCMLLSGSVKHIIISFMDYYKNVSNNKNVLKYHDITTDEYKQLGYNFGKIAKKYGMTVQTCFEEIDFLEYGFSKGVCLSCELAFKLTGKIYKKWTARGCSCAEMVDIGVYNSCKHFCKYCYANFDERKVNETCSLHDVDSSLLIGRLEDSDIIKVRNDKVKVV